MMVPESARIGRFCWNPTYACPLRCIHCYTESGRRAAQMLREPEMRRVVRAIIDARPKRVSVGGGEPLLVPWWEKMFGLFKSAGIPLTVFTSGWVFDDEAAEKLASLVATTTVSVDGPNAAVHDLVRGRAGSFDRAMAALERLTRIRRERTARGEESCAVALDYTVTRSGLPGIDDFVAEASARLPGLDSITFGAAMPIGVAQESGFVEHELLSDDELVGLVEAESRLAARAVNGVRVTVTDARFFLPNSPLYDRGAEIATIEPDGSLRAHGAYEAKVGSLLDEPVDVLWSRALEWRNDPYVREQTHSIHSLADWARASSELDRRYGSDADKQRIARRDGAKRVMLPDPTVRRTG